MVTLWLKGVGCLHHYAAPRHSQLNGATEYFVRILKSAITSINPTGFAELDKGVDNFLMKCRSAAHSTIVEDTSKLFKKRVLRIY